MVSVSVDLAGLVGDVTRELAWVWPPLRWLNRHLGSVDSAIINFSMEKARDAAWSLAEELGRLNESDRDQTIGRRDDEVLQLSHAIRHPGVFVGLVTKVVRLGERGPVSRVIGELE